MEARWEMGMGMGFRDSEFLSSAFQDPCRASSVIRDP